MEPWLNFSVKTITDSGGMEQHHVNVILQSIYDRVHAVSRIDHECVENLPDEGDLFILYDRQFDSTAFNNSYIDTSTDVELKSLVTKLLLALVEIGCNQGIKGCAKQWILADDTTFKVSMTVKYFDPPDQNYRYKSFAAEVYACRERGHNSFRKKLKLLGTPTFDVARKRGTTRNLTYFRYMVDEDDDRNATLLLSSDRPDKMQKIRTIIKYY